jgi:hypothetical protein
LAEDVSGCLGLGDGQQVVGDVAVGAVGVKCEVAVGAGEGLPEGAMVDG